jgi:hypothetical protein
MNKEQEDYIRMNLKWPFSWGDFFLHYSILIVPIIIIVLSLRALFFSYSFDTVLTLVLGLFLTFFILYRVDREKRFRILTIDSNVTFIEIRDKLEFMRWIILDSKVNRLIFLDKISVFSGGCYVTIIRFDDKNILVNTRPFDGQPFTFFRNNINYKKIKTILK